MFSIKNKSGFSRAKVKNLYILNLTALKFHYPKVDFTGISVCKELKIAVRKLLRLRNAIHFWDVYFRNEFKFWNVHGIMNTSGLLQS